MYSLSPTSKEERVSIQENELALEDIRGFVICMYDKQWWLACVLEVDEDSDSVKVNYLHPHAWTITIIQVS